MARSGATVAIDIEVVGVGWEHLDEATRGYLLERCRDDQQRALVPDRLALTPGCGQIIAIGIHNLEEQRGAILVEGEGNQWEPWSGRRDGAFIFRGSEAEMLAAFWSRIQHYGKIVTYCGRTYDGPVLMIRSAMLGITPSRNLVPPRYDRSEHVDLMEVLTFQGALRDRFSLEYWCRRFGIESPKVMLDGSQVERSYRDGQLDLIADYCLRDCRATAELYERLAPTLLAH